MFDEGNVKEFTQQGYTIVDLVNRDKLKNFKQDLYDLILKKINKYKIKINQSVSESDEDYILHEGMIHLERADHAYLSEIYNIVGFSSAVYNIIADENIISCVNKILGKRSTNNLFLNSISCRMDPPGDSPYVYGWHKDRNTNIAGSSFVQFWAPAICDLRADIGGLIVSPRSHRNTEVRTTRTDQEREDHYSGRAVRCPSDTMPINYDTNALHLELKLGQALLFSPDLLHKSAINQSAMQMRYCFTCMYHDPLYSGFKFMNLNVKGKV
jgi:ectoine hydroxylase-related dioxygenase (phytanoyl-CoA dioxygenase family)